jgi:hypothetical protein
MVALEHLKRSNTFRSIFQIIFRELVRSLLKALIKTVKDQFWWCGSISWGVCAWKMDRNMLERFKCFNATILDKYIIIYSSCISWYMIFSDFQMHGETIKLLSYQFLEIIPKWRLFKIQQNVGAWKQERRRQEIQSTMHTWKVNEIRSDLSWPDQENYTVQKAWRALHFVMRIVKKGNKNTKI